MIWLAFLALAAAFIWQARQHAEFKRYVLERLHTLSDKQSAQDATIDGMAADWTRIFGNVEARWQKDLAKTADEVATKLSLERHVPKSRR